MLLMKDIIDDSNELIRTVSKEVELPLSKENHDLLMKMHEFLVASQDEELSEKYLGYKWNNYTEDEFTNKKVLENDRFVLYLNMINTEFKLCEKDENGEIIHFIHGEKGNRDKVYTGDIFVDGSLLGNVNEEIIHDREILAEEGVIILTVNYDSRLRKVISVLSSITKGFSYKLDYNELDKKIAELLTRMVNNSLVKKRFSTEETSKIAEEEVAKLVMRLTKHRPVVICTLIDVNK